MSPPQFAVGLSCVHSMNSWLCKVTYTSWYIYNGLYQQLCSCSNRQVCTLSLAIMYIHVYKFHISFLLSSLLAKIGFEKESCCMYICDLYNVIIIIIIIFTGYHPRWVIIIIQKPIGLELRNYGDGI